MTSQAPVMPSLHLHHFGISVSNLEETVRWYVEKLGFQEAYRYTLPEPEAHVAFLTLSGFRVEIFEVAGAEPMPQSRRNVATDLHIHGLKHVTLRTTDLVAAMNGLKQRGVDFVTDITEVPNSQGERFAFFQDNNGILIELYQPRSGIDAETLTQ